MRAGLACRRHNCLEEARSPMASTKAVCIMLLALVASAALCDSRPALVRLGLVQGSQASAVRIPYVHDGCFYGHCSASFATLLRV